MNPADWLKSIHPHLREFYGDDFDYNRPKVDPARVDMRRPDNIMGHQQRAFTTYWALKQCGPMDLGLDIGSHRGLTPFCIHVDKFYDNETEHPIYGGKIPCDVMGDGGSLIGRFPKNTFNFISSNHSFEHMPVENDAGAVALLKDWISLLRQGGILAMVIPDNAHFDVLGSDRDHKNAWCSGDLDWKGRPGRNFKRGVLEPLLAEGRVELVEFDTFRNFFSFNAVLRK